MIKMELLSFLSMLLALVTLGLGQTTQRASCNLNDEVTCLKAELLAVKVTIEELLFKNRLLERENTDLQEEVQSCRQPVIPSCSQLSVSEKWINGGHRSNSSYNEVITTIQEKNSRSDLYVFNTVTYRMSIINNQLWVSVRTNHTIQILDPNMTKNIKEINLNKVHTNMHPNSVRQPNSNTVFLAANHGLYVLDIHGSVLYKVGSGVITDIAVDCNKANVYNYTNHNVVTVSYNANQWVVTNTFTASSSSKSSYNTITRLNNLIYFASYGSNTIQTYSTNGTHLNTYGIKGTNLPGQLLYPWLCGKDSQGSLLICDEYNHRLQVLSPGGTWQVYVQDGMRYPYDVVVDTSRTLWVLWLDDKEQKYKISKFSS